MLIFLGKRVLQLIPTLFFVSVIIFSLQQLLPGDPALVMAGEERDPAVLEQIRKQYRLDQPIPIQYVYWIKGVLSGDLGESMRLKEPVLRLIMQKFPVTLQLALMAIVVSLAVGVTAGVISAIKKNTRVDYAVNLVALWGLSTPNFWLGIMLIFLFLYGSAGCRRRDTSVRSRISGCRCRRRSCRRSYSATRSRPC
jgi:peptide/nickel transport system permease protein